MDIWTDANINRCRDVDRRIKDRLIDKWRWADKQTGHFQRLVRQSCRLSKKVFREKSNTDSAFKILLEERDLHSAKEREREKVMF